MYLQVPVWFRCDDPEWNRIENTIKTLKALQKQRETFLRGSGEPFTILNEETGEIIPTHVMVKAETVPSIILDVKEVDKHFNEPMKLVEMINKQAGFCVFDIKTKKGKMIAGHMPLKLYAA